MTIQVHHVDSCNCHACVLKRAAEIVAHRQDVWVCADALLRNRKWPDEYTVDPRDVMTVACFLSGELGMVGGGGEE